MILRINQRRQYLEFLHFILNKMNVIIVHGSNSSEKDAKFGKPENERHWMPWLKENLEKKGTNVSNQLYPKDWNPNYNSWKKKFERNNINEKTILVGHSAGCGFLLRWLGKSKRKINKLILVAPAIIKSERWKFINDLLDFEINRNINNFVNEFVIFVSDNDSNEILESVSLLSKIFKIKPIELKNKGHFTLGDMKTKEFPELLNKILE